MSSDDKSGAVLGISLLLIVAVCVFFLWLDVKTNVECREACYPITHERINGGCYCATTTGWEAP